MAKQAQSSWKQGCQSIFAGYVAKVTEAGLPPTIAGFWRTDQAPLLRRTLSEILVLGQADGGRSLDPSGDDELQLQMMLHVILREDSNRLTTPMSLPLPRIPEHVLVGQQWTLTPAGRRTFGLPSSSDEARPSLTRPETSAPAAQR